MNSQSIWGGEAAKEPPAPYLASTSNMASRLARAYGRVRFLGTVSQKTHDQSASPLRRPRLADERD